MNCFKKALLGVSMMCAAAAVQAANLTDHWGKPGESGWGANLVQQDDVLFVTIFVYGADGKATWYVATANRYGMDASGNPGFSAGSLYRTAGPWFGGSTFDPATVKATPVGSLTVQATGPGSATLYYEVDGVKVTKQISRMTFRTKDWGGLYYGAQRANYISCQPGYTPTFFYDSGMVEVEHEGSSFTMQFRGAKTTCDYKGTYQQQGRIGSVTGSYQCNDGAKGDFTMSDMESNNLSLSGKIRATHPSCQVMVQGLSLLNLWASP